MAIKYSRSGESTKSVEGIERDITLRGLIENELRQEFDPALTYTLNEKPITGETALRDGDHVIAAPKVSGGC